MRSEALSFWESVVGDQLLGYQLLGTSYWVSVVGDQLFEDQLVGDQL